MVRVFFLHLEDLAHLEAAEAAEAAEVAETGEAAEVAEAAEAAEVTALKETQIASHHTAPAAAPVNREQIAESAATEACRSAVPAAPAQTPSLRTESGASAFM